jgi:DNA repair protein RadA/Sms
MNISISESCDFTKIDDIEIPDIYNRRFKTNIDYLDGAFCSEGWIPGCTFTISGTPGSGKTTLLCQLLQQLALNGKRVAYVSGEESVYQLAYNCRRTGSTDVFAANITDLKKVSDAIKQHKFEFIVLDSIPCFTMPGLFYSKQEREEAKVRHILEMAHENECVVGCVLHVTKTGSYKGSTLLPHAVDACYHLKRDEDDSNLRILENNKNRFGCAQETVLKMTSQGFSFEPIENEPSEATISRVSVLTQRVQKIIDYISEHGSVDMKTASELCENNQQNAYLAIRNAVNSKMLRKEGRGDFSRWFKV